MAGSWRKDRVVAAPTPRSSHRFLVAISLAFVVGLCVGISEYSHFLAASVARTVAHLVTDGGADGDGMPSPMELLGRVARERASTVERVFEEEYGEYYGLVFDETLVSEDVFLLSDASRARLRRRVQIKVLEANVGVTQQAEAAASPSSSTAPPRRPTFVWATAGDSAAAGHGNLFDQSYTAVLEDTVAPAFRSVGVDFVARNYAMGGYVSAPELALCMESVYGSDLDVLTWDFGLTEGRDEEHRAALWAERAGTHPTRPVLFLMDDAGSSRWARFRSFEGRGMGTVLMDRKAMGQIRRRVPDSNQHPDPDSLPPALRYYVCNGATEGNVPCNDPMRNFVCEIEEGGLCKSNKFKTRDACGPGGVRFQTSWHPGWKEHRLRGRFLGHFMLDVLSEALMELDELGNATTVPIGDGDPHSLLNFLYSQEGADVAQFHMSPPLHDVWQTNRDTLLEVNPATVFRRSAICHTALLPAQSRFDGLVTGSGKAGDHRGGYDLGWNKALMPYPEDGRLPLAYDANDRQRCDALEIDHKDFFFVREGDGWLGTTVPSAEEARAYGRDEPRVGMIMVCLKICPLGRCPDESVGFGYIRRNLGRLFIEIDGRPVKQIKKLEGCHFLEGEQGVRWESSSDQYDIKFRVDDPGTNHWMKISSIVIF